MMGKCLSCGVPLNGPDDIDKCMMCLGDRKDSGFGMSKTNCPSHPDNPPLDADDCESEHQQEERIEAIGDLKTQCADLIVAFQTKMAFLQDDPRRKGPLTPNDPATIAMLAAELLSYLQTPEPVKDFVKALETVKNLSKICERTECPNRFPTQNDEIET